MSEPPLSRVDASNAVFDSLGIGWKRMLDLLFRGPGANVRNWAMWGLILLIASVTGGGNAGSNWNVPAEEDDFRLPGPGDIEPWMIAVAAAIFVLLIAVVVVWLYFQSRFRFVMLEGVRTGVPRIQGVFGTTRRAGTHYFFFQLFVSVGSLLLLAPVLLMWIPVLTPVFQGGDVGPIENFLVLLIVTIVWAVAIAFAAAVVQWWVYDVALPHVWLGRIDFRAGLRRAWSLTTDRLGAVLLFLLMRVLIGIAGAIATCLLGCASCVLWIWPVLLIVAAVFASIAFPPAWILTGPLILVLFLVTIWIMATVTAPIALFYRSWSWAFVNQLDPSLPLWEAQLEDPGPEVGR